MGGKGGGGGNYYQQSADTSGNGTLEEAEKTLAAKQPLDMSGYQQNIDVKKAANDATAKPPATTTPPAEQTPTDGQSGTSTTTDDSTGSVAARAVLTPPGFWADYGKKPDPENPTATTTQI